MINAVETDLLGAPYLVETIPLGRDDDGVIEATLVARPADGSSGGARRAVLYVHGFCDYFFQTEWADWWTARGYDFYALDLRRYGRSLRDHQLAGYTTDVHEYFEELDAAWSIITERDGHDEVVLTAHSTGGLIVPLWADARREALAGRVLGVVLNSPWVDMHGPFWLRTAGTALIKQVGNRTPRREVPRTVSGLYGQSLHVSESGEWDYDLDWKPLTSWPVYFGWLAAIRRGHAELHRGIDVGAPVLVLVSSRTSRPTEMCDDVHTSDIVLDVEQIRRWSTVLSRQVTVISIEDAIHDVILSSPPVRATAYAALERWHDAYLH